MSLADEAVKKFGLPLLKTYFAAHSDWYFGEFGTNSPERKRVTKVLYENRKILQFINPISSLPPVLYRGMSSLKNFPEKGQTVLYTNKFSPVASFSAEKDTPKEFCGGTWNTGGIFLQLDTKEISGKAELILWPFPESPWRSNENVFWEFEVKYQFSSPGYRVYRQQKEYVLYIRKPLLISSWSLCG